MSSARAPLGLALSATLLAGCSVAPVMKETQVGLGQVARLEQGSEKKDPGSIIAGYRKYLAEQASFDQPAAVYIQKFDGVLESLSSGQTAREVPIDGIPHYYVRHVQSMAKAYLGLAEAYLAKGDLGRAQRHALNAAELVEKRINFPFSFVVMTEIQEEAYGVLEKVFKKSGVQGDMTWAQMQRKLYTDHLLSPDARKGYASYVASRKDGAGQLAQANSFISQLNSQKSGQTFNTVLAVLSAAGGAMASFQEAQLRSQIQSQGYATSSQASALQTAKLNQFTSDMALKMTAGKAGAWGENLTLMRAASNATMFQQFTRLDAGVNPTAIVQEFAKRGKILGAGNSALVMRANTLTQESQSMEKARKSGDQKAAQGAYGSFLPALTNFTNELRKVR